MLEEIVGSTWHRFITRRAETNYPNAAVYLDDIRHTAGIYFRALGGEGALRVLNSTETQNHARRSIVQRIAGIGDKTRYAWREEESLRLPDSITLFASKQLNYNLYLWLTALSAIPLESTSSVNSANWISRNQYRTAQTLEHWPGLKDRYHLLLEAHLQQRPDANQLPVDEAMQENTIRAALKNPNRFVVLNYARRPPQPVPLWLHPAPPQAEFTSVKQVQDPDMAEAAQRKNPQTKQKTRKPGTRTDMPDGQNGLMSFRLESLWSWAEYTRVDRTTTDDDDDDALRTAEDMDNITVAQDAQTTSNKIKLDLDLPSTEYDDIPLGEGIPIDEWDYKRQCYQKNHCRVQTMQPRHVAAMQLPARLQVQARKVRRRFEVIQPQRLWENRQHEGTEIDLESYLEFLANRGQGHVNSDTPVYRQLRNKHRDLACLLLADLSLSTDAHINNEARVIDVIRDTLFLFSEALNATGDHFALHGFSSRNRSHVRFYNLKGFDEKYDDTVRGLINAIRPGYYTRMGTAIRRASQLLEKEPAQQKLLLILTDGKPNDLDKYEGRYGLEDTRMAVLEAQKLGLRPFCVTIDEEAGDYLPYLFGSHSYVLVRNAAELPKKLPLLYLRLTQ